MLILAGYPKDMIESYKAAGIDKFIYMGANALEVLSAAQKQAGVE